MLTGAHKKPRFELSSCLFKLMVVFANGLIVAILLSTIVLSQESTTRLATLPETFFKVEVRNTNATKAAVDAQIRFEAPEGTHLEFASWEVNPQFTKSKVVCLAGDSPNQLFCRIGRVEPQQTIIFHFEGFGPGAELTVHDVTGQLSQGPIVETDSPSVETVSPIMGTTLATEYGIQNCPLSGRNALDLALLQPGVLPKGINGHGKFSIAGGRHDSVTFLLDGGIDLLMLRKHGGFRRWPSHMRGEEDHVLSKPTISNPELNRGREPVEVNDLRVPTLHSPIQIIRTYRSSDILPIHDFDPFGFRYAGSLQSGNAQNALPMPENDAGPCTGSSEHASDDALKVSVLDSGGADLAIRSYVSASLETWVIFAQDKEKWIVISELHLNPRDASEFHADEALAMVNKALRNRGWTLLFSEKHNVVYRHVDEYSQPVPHLLRKSKMVIELAPLVASLSSLKVDAPPEFITRTFPPAQREEALVSGDRFMVRRHLRVDSFSSEERPYVAIEVPSVLDRFLQKPVIQFLRKQVTNLFGLILGIILGLMAKRCVDAFKRKPPQRPHIGFA